MGPGLVLWRGCSRQELGIAGPYEYGVGYLEPPSQTIIYVVRSISLIYL
jgi:hypothetical protein